MALNFWDYDPDDLDVRVTELLLATASSSDALIDPSVQTILHSLREHLGQEVIFVSEISNGMRVFRHVDHAPDAALIATGQGDVLEASFCKCVIEGHMPRLMHDVAASPLAAKLPATPFRVGAHLSSPIVLADGRLYGTLCSFSREGDASLNERDLKKLDCVARVMARRIDARQPK